MSLILEALKKSERQRQIGHAPTLATPMMTRRRRRSPLPWLVGAIVIAAGAGWWLSRDRIVGTPAVPAQSAPAAAKSSRPAAPMTVTPPPKKPGAGAAARAAAPAGPEAKLAEVERAVAAAAPQVPAAAPDAAAATTAPAKSTPAAAKSRQAGAGGSDAKASPAAAAGAPLPRTSPTPTGPVAAPAASAAPPPAATPPPAPVATAAPSPSAGLPLLWELPYDRRKDIPKLAMSLQVYSADPASRFAIVNDERHKEGDTIADGLVLREITPEGLVLEFQGERFLYPRGGR